MGLEANFHEVLGLSYGYDKGFYGYGNHIVWQNDLAYDVGDLLANLS